MIGAAEFYKWLKIFGVSFGPFAGSLTINTGSGLTGGGLVSIGGNITISATGAPIDWQEITGTTQAMSPNVYYAANNAALVTFTLPVSANPGDSIEVYGKGAGGWRINQNAGQQIIVGTSETTAGVTGNLLSTYKYDIVSLRCLTSNNVWTASVKSGNILVN